MEALKQHFVEQGWVVLKLPNPEPVFEVRRALLEELRKITQNDQVTLEQYHELSEAEEDQQHTKWQFHLTQFFRDQRFGQKIIAAQLDFFKDLLGPDLSVQSNPYLRIVRPNKPQDNIGYHRDTMYGNSPFELSVMIPYTDLTAESALSILSGSHIRPETDFPIEQIESPEVKKGSIKNQLGFLYAPKIINPSATMGIQAIPIKLGEALMFSQATVHGSLENKGAVSRWSSDIRVVNTLAPLNPSLKPGYYELLSRSVVTETAIAYREANA